MMMDFNFKTLSLNQAIAQNQSVYRTDSANNTQIEKLKIDKIQDGNLMSTLTMSAVGLLTQRLWKCKMTTDIMVAAAGGALFVGGEILSFLKLKKVMKKMETQIVRDKDGKIDQKQIEILQKLKKSYEEAKETAGTKKMLQQAAAAAFAAAGALALTQALTETAAETACTAALQLAATACNAKGTALAAGVKTAPLAPPFFAGAIQALKALFSETKADLAEKVPAPSNSKLVTSTVADKTNTAVESAAAGQCPMIAAATATCEGKRTIKMATRGVCPVPPSVVDVPTSEAGMFYAGMSISKPKSNPIFDLISNYFLSSAHADLLAAIGIASSAARSYLLATSATLGVTIDTFLFAPMNRAMVWGVLAGLTFMASSATDNVIAQLDSNISKIDAILNGMNSLGNGIALSNPTIKNPATKTKTPGGALGLTTLKYDDAEIGLEDLPNGKLPCYTGGDEKKCTTFEEKLKENKGFASLNLPSKDLVTGIVKAADGFNGRSKITTAAMIDAGKLAGNANAINASLKKNRDLLRDQLKKSKIDLDQREKEFSDAIENNTRAQLKKSGLSANQMLGSMYGGSSFPGATGVASAPGEGEGENAVEVASVAPAGDMIDINAGLGTGETDLGLAGLEGGEMTAEEKAAQDAAALVAADAAAASSIDEYDLKNDITKDKETSIFELISNRYQKSGYPRLFKRIK